MSHEADVLRSQIKEYILSSYTEDERVARVPAIISEHYSREQFVERYCTCNWQPLPPASGRT